MPRRLREGRFQRPWKQPKEPKHQGLCRHNPGVGIMAAIVPPSALARVIQRWRGHAEASVIFVPERSTRERRAATCVCSARARDHRSLESTRSPVCPPGSPTVAFSHAVLAPRIPCPRVPIGEPPITSDRRRPACLATAGVASPPGDGAATSPLAHPYRLGRTRANHRCLRPSRPQVPRDGDSLRNRRGVSRCGCAGGPSPNLHNGYHLCSLSSSVDPPRGRHLGGGQASDSTLRTSRAGPS